MKSLKKGIIFIIILAMVMAFVPSEKVQADTPTENINVFYISLGDKSFASSAIPGDVNLDGYVTGKDRKIISRYLSKIDDKLTEQALLNIDANKDGELNSSDSICVDQIVNGETRQTGVNELRNGESIKLYAYNSTEDSIDETKITSSSSITWSSSDETLATVDTSSNDGSATITANSNGKTGDVTITATSGDHTDSFVLHIVNSINKVMQTGITLESDNIKKEATKHTVYVTVDSACMDNGVAGFSARVGLLNSNYLQGEPTMTCITEDWKITESKFSDDIVTFTAEAKDNILDSIDSTTSVKIAIQYDVTDSTTGEQGIEIPYSLFTRADVKNNVNKPATQNLVLYLVKEGNILEVKDGYTDEVKIVGNDIYAKLDSSSTTEEKIDAAKLTDTLKVATGYTLEIDSTNNTNKKVYTGAKLNLKNSSNTTIAQYNIYLIGDICKDSSNVININDVSYLRQAIVGKDMTSKTDYEVKTTDVNWSNGTPEEPGLGDIGDVIAIRRRILNYKWDDIVPDDTIPVVTTPPTTAVTEKTKFKDEDGNVAVIPEGFKVSSEESEQKIDTGLVVIAPDGSEFVWVPVEDVSTMYGTLEDGTKAGKLYDFTDSNVENNTAKNWTETNGVMSLNETYGDREPDILEEFDNDTDYNNGLFTKETLQKEFDDMIDSVSKNGGFYVGRYETSLNGTKAQSKKGETSATGAEDSANKWYGLYQKEKEYSEKNSLTNVVGSSMIWGSQYDQMMIWMQKNGYDVASTEPKTGLSKNYGTRSAVGTTGTVETDKLNNVYDLIGNGYEWTLEAYYDNLRVVRGGHYASDQTPKYGFSYGPNTLNHLSSSRLALYIK